MPLNTFDPPVRPSPGTSFSNKIKLREVEFGDGYTLASPAGLNHIRKQVSLKWDALSLGQVWALDAFFTGQGGNVPFYYTLHGEDTPRKWTCKEWSFSDGTPATFSASLEENFSNAT